MYLFAPIIEEFLYCNNKLGESVVNKLTSFIKFITALDAFCLVEVYNTIERRIQDGHLALNLASKYSFTIARKAKSKQPKSLANSQTYPIELEKTTTDKMTYTSTGTKATDKNISTSNGAKTQNVQSLDIDSKVL